MNTIMKLDNLQRIEQMQSFIDGTQAVAFVVASSKAERYQFVEKIFNNSPASDRDCFLFIFRLCGKPARTATQGELALSPWGTPAL